MPWSHAKTCVWEPFSWLPDGRVYYGCRLNDILLSHLTRKIEGTPPLSLTGIWAMGLRNQHATEFQCAAGM